MDQQKRRSINEDLSMVAQDGLRGSLDNLSINSVPRPLAASTVARDKDRLKEQAQTDARGSFLEYGLPATPEQGDQLRLSFSNLNEAEQMEVFNQAQELVKEIEDESHTLTEFESSTTLGILEVDAMTDLSSSQFLLDKQTDNHQLSSLASSDCQLMGRSREVNTVKKQPGLNDTSSGDSACVRGNLFGGNLSDMHEETEFDQSIVNVHFDEDEIDSLDQDFSDLIDFDNEHGQGEGQESDEENKMDAFQTSTHGLDMKYFSPSHNSHFVGDGEDSQLNHSRNNRIIQQKPTTDTRREQRSQLSALREQFCNGDGSDIDTDDELEAARTSLRMEQGKRDQSIGQDSTRPGLEGEPDQSEENRFSLMLRQSAEGEIVSSPVPGDGGGGGDGTSGSESDDGQKTTTSSVTGQSVPHRFAAAAAGTVYPTTYKPDPFPEEERIRPMGDDLLNEVDSRSFSAGVYSKEQTHFGTSSLQGADNKLLESWYLAPSGENYDGVQGGLTDSIFQNTGISDSILTGSQQTGSSRGLSDSILTGSQQTGSSRGLFDSILTGNQQTYSSHGLSDSIFTDSQQTGSPREDNQEIEEPLDVMQSSLGSFGIPQTKISADSANDATFTSNTGSNPFDASVVGTNLCLKTSLSEEASMQMEMFKTGNDSALPSEDNFFESNKALDMLDADEEEFVQENIFRKDAQMEADESAYQSIVTNSQSSWDEYNPLLNASMGLYWAARTENLGTLDGNPSCPRPEFGMVIRSPPQSSRREPLYRTSGVGDEDGDNTLIMEDLFNTPTTEAVTLPTSDVSTVKQSLFSEEISHQTTDQSFANKTNCIDSSAMMSFLRKPPTDGSPGTYMNTLIQIAKSKSSKTAKSHLANSDENINKTSKESKVSCLPVKKGSNVGMTHVKKRQQRTPVAVKILNSEPTVEPFQKNTFSPAERDVSTSEREKYSTTSQAAKKDNNKTNQQRDKPQKETTTTSTQNNGSPKERKKNVIVSVPNVSSINVEQVSRDCDFPRESKTADEQFAQQVENIDSEWMIPRVSMCGKSVSTCGKSQPVRNREDYLLSGGVRDGWEGHHKEVTSRVTPAERMPQRTDTERMPHRTDTGYWSVTGGHHEPDGTEYSAASNYLSTDTDKILSRDHAVGTSDIEMAESRGYRVVSIEPSSLPSRSIESSSLQSRSIEPSSLQSCSIELSSLPSRSIEPSSLPSCSIELSSLPSRSSEPSTLPSRSFELSSLPSRSSAGEVSSNFVSVSSMMTSNSKTLCRSPIPSNKLDNNDSYFRVSATPGLTSFSGSSPNHSSYQTHAGMFPNTDRNSVTEFTNIPPSTARTGSQPVMESCRISRDFVSNSSGMQPNRNQEMDFSRMSPSRMSPSRMVINSQNVPNEMTDYVSNTSLMEVTDYVPNMSTFEPLRESLSCSRWSPGKPDYDSRLHSRPSCLDKENSTRVSFHGNESAMQTFRDVDETTSRFNPGVYSTPFFSQTTYVTPSHARSVFSTMPADGAASANGSMSATPCKTSMLLAPSVLNFSTPCYTGTSITSELPLKNVTPHWLECVAHVDSLVVNGREVDPQEHSPFHFKTNITVKPKSEEMLGVMFLPSVPGIHVATVTIFTKSLLVDVKSTSMFVGINVTFQAVAEVPRIELITREKECISFGELAWGLCIGSQFGIVNLCKSDVPIRLVISSVNSTWHCFSFDNGSQSRDPSMISNSGVFSITLPGYDEQTEKTVEHIQIYCRPPAKSIDRVMAMKAPERLVARLDVELDTPSRRVKPIATVLLKATVGVVKLKTSPAIQNIMLKCQFEEEAQEGVMLKNAGNITMHVELFVSTLEDMFTIEPKSLSIPAHSTSPVTIKFSPNKPDISLYKTLFIMLVEQEAQAYELELTGEMQVRRKPARSYLQGDKSALVFGGVAIGQAKQLKTYIRNSALTSLVVSVAINCEASCFQLLEVMSDGETINSDRIVMKPKDQIKIHVVFSPSTQQFYTGKLVFRYSEFKFCVDLYGFGGTSCIELEGATNMGMDLFQINVGHLSRGLNSKTNVILRNTGARSAYVKAVAYSDRHGFSPLKLGNVVMDPNEFVISPNNSKVVSIVMSLSNWELALCRENKEVVGYVILYWGDEILRQNYRRAINNRQSSKMKLKNPTLQSIKFEVVYVGETPQTEEETSHKTSKQDIDVFYQSVHQTCLSLIGEPPIHEDLSVTTPSRLLLGNQLEHREISRRVLSSTAPSLDIPTRLSVQKRCEMFVSTISEVNVQETPTNWDIQPKQIILTTFPSSTEVVQSRKFKIHNFASINLSIFKVLSSSITLDEICINSIFASSQVGPPLKRLVVGSILLSGLNCSPTSAPQLVQQRPCYELQWPGHMVMVDPTHGIVNPKCSVSVLVVPAVNAHKYLNQMLWNGIIRVEVKNVSKLLQVQVKMEAPVNDTSVDGSFNNLTAQLSTTNSMFIPNTPNDAIQMSKLEVRFLPTKDGSKSEDILEFTNISGCPVTWMLSSFAPPYMKLVSDNKEVFRVEYSVFLFIRKSGQLNPNETAKISVWFQPQSRGLYTQYWDIICKMKSAARKTSSKTRVHLVGEGQDAEEQATAVSLPRGVTLELPVSDKPTVSKSAPENKELDKRAGSLVYLTSSLLTFAPSAVGKCISKKIQIGNDSEQQHEVKVVAPRPPFYVRHMTFQINGNKFLNYPIEFRGKVKGIFNSWMAFETEQGKLYLDLHGECV